jgi:hypothetical protein
MKVDKVESVDGDADVHHLNINLPPNGGFSKDSSINIDQPSSNSVSMSK